MTPPEKPIEVYLEIGQTRAFASALAWPGWCRSGRGEAAALQALCDYAPRYARVLRPAGLPFAAPGSVAALDVVERLAGNAATDFGAPGRIPAYDTLPLAPGELEHLQAVLSACWAAFDAAALDAEGKALRKGPRGGGRDLAKIVQHVREAELSYLASLGGKLEPGGEARPAILAALAASARGEIPARGPRGGLRWSPRYFTRRAAWHVLDHGWEIEDRGETLK